MICNVLLRSPWGEPNARHSPSSIHLRADRPMASTCDMCHKSRHEHQEPMLGCLNDMQKKFIGKTKALIQVTQENLRKAHKRFMSHDWFMSPMSSESILKQACDWPWHPCHLSWAYCHFFLLWMVQGPCITLYLADHFSKYLSCKPRNLRLLTRRFARAKHSRQASWQPQLEQAASRADWSGMWCNVLELWLLWWKKKRPAFGSKATTARHWVWSIRVSPKLPDWHEMAIKKVLPTWMFEDVFAVIIWNCKFCIAPRSHLIAWIAPIRASN